jgi:hypothetical protein
MESFIRFASWQPNQQRSRGRSRDDEESEDLLLGQDERENEDSDEDETSTSDTSYLQRLIQDWKRGSRNFKAFQRKALAPTFNKLFWRPMESFIRFASWQPERQRRQRSGDNESENLM